MERYGDFIITCTKQKFYPLDPRPNEVNWLDITHALSNICRFTGHCSEFYSVAQHSVLVSEIVPPECALAGLLHDAAEAYICDLAKPVKENPIFDSYRAVEKRIQEVIFQAAGIDLEIPPIVKDADITMLRTEARDLELITPEWGIYDLRPLPMKIIPWSPKDARRRFAERFDSLYFFGKAK
jgi:hypothetical protein